MIKKEYRVMAKTFMKALNVVPITLSLPKVTDITLRVNPGSFTRSEGCLHWGLSKFFDKQTGGARNTMWTIEKLKNRFSMSDQQIYRRINAAQRPLGKHINRGEKNAIALSDGGFLILENVIELEKQGKTLANAVLEIEKSIVEEDQFEVNFEGTRQSDSYPLKNRDKHDETQSRQLIEEIGYLKGKLDSKDELLDELKVEVKRLRQENDDLKRSVALVEYKASERRSWWPWRT